MIKWGDRLRIAFVLFVLSMWIFIIDGVNYIINFSEADEDAAGWAVWLVLIQGLVFGLIGMFASFMIFFWYEPKIAGYIMVSISILCGSLRLICVIFGFQDFDEESHLNSTTNLTTDIAIAAFQFYQIIEGFFIVRNHDRMGDNVTYSPVHQ